VKSPTTFGKEIAMNSNIIVRSSKVLVFSIAALTVSALLTSLVPDPAFADEPVHTETVKFADLNVDSPDGVQSLYSRIHAAGERVCSQPELGAGPDKECEAKAESEAVQKLSLPLLTAYYQNKTGSHQSLIATR
jgi:UrcA family protein